MAKADQAGLPGIPQAPKRKAIAAMEEFGIEDDKLAAKIVKLSDERAENKQAAIEKMRELGIKIYTFERADGTLEDLVIEDVLRKRKSALNPKKEPKSKKEE